MRSDDEPPDPTVSRGTSNDDSELDVLRLVLDQIREAIIRTDPEFRVLDWSPTAERMYGYSAEEAVGALFTDIVHTRYEDTDHDTVRARFREHGHWHGEALQRGKGDREVRVLASVTRLHDEAGAPVGVVAINRDVTEAYERSAALRESELRFRQFAENSEDVFWMSDLREPRMLFVSDGYERVWGRSRESLLDDPTSFMKAIHPDDRARVQAALGRQLEGCSTSEEYRVVRTDGSERWIHDQGFPVRGADGRIERVAGVARDITELRAAERKRKELEARVQQAQRLESLGVLAGGIAHDYNNMLTGVMGNLELALLQLHDLEVVRESIHHAVRGLHAMADLTKQLVLYAGKGRGPAAAITWNAVVGEMSGLLETSLTGRARLQPRLSSEATPIRLSDQQARIVLLNLATNAAEAIGDGDGTIVIETRAVDIDAATLQQRRPDLPARAGRYSCLVVSDDGCGIARADLDRVFDPFYSTKFQGRGMGLASVYGIVREGGGWVAADSRPETGTTFTVYLPVGPTGPAERTDPSPVRARPRVLVAEDELFVRRVLVRLLERIGYQVETARDGQEVLGLYLADPGDVDLVVLDVNMPVMSGLEARARIRAHDRSVPILLCTGGTDPQIADILREDPSCALLEKPFKLDDLTRCIAALTAKPQPA